MTLHISNRRSVIYLTLLTALVLKIMPLPVEVAAWRPDWALLTVVYWTLALPHRVNVGNAWLIGLTLDVLLGTTLGVHALAFSIASYIAALHFQRIRNFSLWQQALIVGALVFLSELLQYWAEYMVHDIVFDPAYLLPGLTSLLMWPWIFLLLRKIRRKFKIR